MAEPGRLEMVLVSVLSVSGQVSVPTTAFTVPSDGTVSAVVGTLNWPDTDSTLTNNISSLPGSAIVGSTYNLFQYTTFSGGPFSSPVVNLPSGYTGHLTNNVSPYIQLVIDTAPSVILPTIPPGTTNFSLAGTNVVLSGTNGQPGRTYYLLASTNVAQPLNQWVAVATNVLGAANFTFIGTNAVPPNVPQRFYILSNTNN